MKLGRSNLINFAMGRRGLIMTKQICDWYFIMGREYKKNFKQLLKSK
jgi:hypothetical protein